MFGSLGRLRIVRIPGTAWSTAFTTLVNFQYLENVLTFLFVIPVKQSSVQLAQKVLEIYATSVYVPGAENQSAGKCKFWGVTKLM